MLSTGFPQFWGWLALGLGAFATIVAFSAVNEARKMADYCGQCTNFMHENNMEALKDSKLAAFESALTELSDSFSSLKASHERLRSKYGMRDLREKRKNGEDVGDAHLQTEFDFKNTRDKAALRLELRKLGLLK